MSNQHVDKKITTKRPTSKKRFKIFWKVISNMLHFAFIFGIIIAAIQFANSENSKKSIFGYRVYYVMSSSMEPDLPVGSLILTEVMEPHELQMGDYITYYLPNKVKDYRTHQIIDILPNYKESGSPGFQTQGINLDKPDTDIVPGGLVVGKVVYSLPWAGYFFHWLTSNWIIVLVMIALMYILIWAMRRKKMESSTHETTYINQEDNQIREEEGEGGIKNNSTE